MRFGGAGRALVTIALVAVGLTAQGDCPAEAGLHTPPSLGLQMRSYSLGNGLTLEEVDDSALDVLTAVTASDPCGSACDDKSPTYVWTNVPGGPSAYFSCAEDAVTKYGIVNSGAPHHSGGNYVVELRYSPRCRSAWARGNTYFETRLQSFKGTAVRATRYERGSQFPPYNSIYTVMLNDANLTANACYYSDWVTNETWHCTAKY